MLKEKKLIMTDNEVYTVGYLRSVSWYTLETAKKNYKGSYLSCIASIVFSAFTLEAYFNYLGELIFPDWSSNKQSLSPLGKLEIIASKQSKTIDFGRRPFRSFKIIFQFRNSLAHAKTEILKSKRVQWLSVNDKPKLPKTKWQKQVTIKNAQRFLDDTKEMIEYLHESSGLDFNPLYTPEISGWTAIPLN